MVTCNSTRGAGPPAPERQTVGHLGRCYSAQVIFAVTEDLGDVRFFDADGRPLKPVFTESNRVGCVLGFGIIESGVALLPGSGDGP